MRRPSFPPLIALTILLGTAPASVLATAPASAEPVVAREVAERLAAAIRFPTVSHQDPEQFDGAPFDALLDYLAETYPRTHALQVERVNRHSLLIEWPGSDASLPPALFMSHLDVVPVELAAAEGWTHPPFAGVIADGFVWGRGALDVKNGVILWLEAAERLLASGFTPQRSLFFAFGHDEEIGGEAGAAKIAARLKEKGLHFAFLVDEGGFISEDLGLVPGRRVAQINTAEKTYFTIQITARGEGGHSSTPPPHTAVGKLATAIHRLEANPLPLRLTRPVRDLLEALAPHVPTGRRLALGNLWLTAPFVIRSMAEDPFQAALLRTTTAVTMVEGGVKENVVPKHASATVNFRILPGETPDDVLDHVRRTIADPEIEISHTEWSAAPRPGRVTGLGYGVLQDAVEAVHPDVVVVPGMLMGATDTRHFADLVEDAYRFIGNSVTRAQVTGFHGTDERIGVDSMGDGVRVHEEILRRAGTP